MMIAPLDITIEGLTFQSKKLTPLDVLRLDKVVLGLFAPALSGVGKNANGKLEIAFDKSAASLSNLLIQLPDDVVNEFLLKAFSRTIWLGTEGNVELKTEVAINKAFAEVSVVAIYKLLWEVLRYNGLSFFGLMDTGIAMLKTSGFAVPMPNANPSGNGSATSEGSTQA